MKFFLFLWAAAVLSCGDSSPGVEKEENNETNNGDLLPNNDDEALEIGDSCGRNDQCDSDFCQRKSECDEFGTCQPILPAGEPCNADSRCANNSVCVEATGLCTKRDAAGGEPCQQGTCIGNQLCPDDTQICSPLRLVGEPCLTNRYCKDELICDSGICAEPKLEGDACDAALPGTLTQCLFPLLCDEDVCRDISINCAS